MNSYFKVIVLLVPLLITKHDRTVGAYGRVLFGRENLSHEIREEVGLDF